MACRRRNAARLAALVLVACVTGASRTIAADVRNVIELFTSQGCESCPPADKIIGELSKQPDTIALTLAVDYWDYLGWHDTLALAGHGTRQRAYARARGDRDVFTPQAVINGSAEALGSDRAQIEQAIQKTHRLPATLAVPLNLSIEGQDLRVSVAKGTDQASQAEVWLCPLSKTVPVEIARGENKGRSIVYHNVVRRWIKVGNWTGIAADWKVPLTEFRTPAVDQVAVVVQSGTAAAPSTIVSAGMISLP
jgi:hypothetical protein